MATLDAFRTELPESHNYGEQFSFCYLPCQNAQIAKSVSTSCEVYLVGTSGMREDLLTYAIAKREKLQSEIDELDRFLRTAEELFKEIDSNIMDSENNTSEKLAEATPTIDAVATEDSEVSRSLLNENASQPAIDPKRAQAMAYVQALMRRNHGALNQVRMNFSRSNAAAGNLALAAE